MNKISIIIPLYNDAAHIGRCLESICAQTVADRFEVVIVDDGSTDDSVGTAEKVLEQHRRRQQADIIRLKENKGVANARKIGALAAKTEFVLYCDSDDYMEPEMCWKLLNKAEEEGCDVVVCDYNSIHGEQVETVRGCYKENFLQELILCTVTGALWNKLIRTSLLQSPDFRFPIRDFSEDYVYCLQLAIHARKFGYIPEPLYNYVHRDNSVVLAQSPEKRRKRYDDDMENFRLDLEILKDNGLLDKFKGEIIAHKLKMKNTYVGTPALWKQTFPELWWQILTSGHVSWRSRISYFIKLIKTK